MQQLQHSDIFFWAADFCQDQPEGLTVDKARVKGGSKTLLRSIKAIYRGLLCSWYFSCNCRATKILSAVPLFGRNPLRKVAF
jgi:hypothetical protein